MEPKKTVTRLKTSRAACAQLPDKSWGPMRKKVTRTMASTPILVMTPESTALAGAGATGCAVGSQPCSG